ncbi:MAG: hypothetical protein OEP52_01890 [Acidimicrobiia bacterium]|nr:hypothetical protein [Acidimicrobiia bacterium]
MIPPLPDHDDVVRADRYARLGLAFLTTLGALVVVPWAFLVLRVSSVAGWMVIPALAATAATVALFAPASGRAREVTAAMTVVVGALLIAGIVAHNIYDGSWDGRTYHADAIIALEDGWNPFQEPHPAGFGYGNTVRSFPKASWLAAATLYDLTDSVEVGKSIDILPLGGSFLLTLALLTRLGIRRRVAGAGAALAAANPVWVVQSLSNYVDGQSAALLLAAIASGLWILLVARDLVASWSLGLSLLVLINLKFSGIYYAGLVLMALTIVLLWQRRREDLRRFFVAQGVVIVLAVGAVGFNPYVQNFLDFDHPLYPIAGSDRIDFFTPNSPVNLRGASQLEQLTYGVFGEPNNGVEELAVLDWPFNPANLTRATPYSGSDTRIAGLGPFFSGALLLATGLWVWLLWRERAHSREQVLMVGALAAFLIVSWALHAEGWWARYTPQLWLVPVAVAILALTRSDRISRWMGGGLAAILALNLLFVGGVHLRSRLTHTWDVSAIYETFAGEPILVSLPRFQAATRVQLEEAGLAMEEFPTPAELPCATPAELPAQAGFYCPAGWSTGR